MTGLIKDCQQGRIFAPATGWDGDWGGCELPWRGGPARMEEGRKGGTAL